MQKNYIAREKENERENKKLNEFFTFIKLLKTKKNLKLTEKNFNKELILFFNITDFRVVASKIKLMETLDLIKVNDLGFGEKEVLING